MTRLRRSPIPRWLSAWVVVTGGLLGCGGEPEPLDPRLQREKPSASLLAVGDTGRPHRWFPDLFEGQVAVANGMAAEDEREPVDALILLGDNFYDSGLVRETMPDQIRQNLVYPYCRFVTLNGPRSEEVAGACTDPRSQNHPTQFLAVLGNHDLETPGSAELQCQEVGDFVSNWQMPCAFSKTVELGNGVSVILFFSEKLPTAEQVQELEEAVRKAKGPWRVLASHRPIIMNDDSHPLPRGSWVDHMLARIDVPVHAFLSGHHHNLQLLETSGPGPYLHAIVGSGARARGRPPNATKHPARRYGAEQLGFARIDVFGSGEDQRLAVSLFATPDYPFLGGAHPRLVSRWSVDQNGNTRDELATAESP